MNCWNAHLKTWRRTGLLEHERSSSGFARTERQSLKIRHLRKRASYERSPAKFKRASDRAKYPMLMALRSAIGAGPDAQFPVFFSPLRRLPPQFLRGRALRPPNGLGFRAWFTMIASNDNNHSEPHDASSQEPSRNGASTDIDVIEAAYHDGVVAGVAAMGLIAPVRPEHDNVDCHRAFQAGLAAGIKERQQMVMRLFVSGLFS